MVPITPRERPSPARRSRPMRPVLRAGLESRMPRTIRWRVLACTAGLTGLLVATVEAQTVDQQPTPPRPPAQGAAPAAPTPNFLSNIKWDVEFGGQGWDLNGDRPGKFQETRDVPKGFYARTLRLDLRTANSPFFAVAHATDIRELDQRVRVDAGRIGKFRSTFVWDQLPHSYSEGRTLFTETSPGFLQVSPAIRT